MYKRCDVLHMQLMVWREIIHVSQNYIENRKLKWGGIHGLMSKRFRSAMEIYCNGCKETSASCQGYNNDICSKSR